MKRYERIITIIMVYVLCISNVAPPVAYAAKMGKFHAGLSHGNTFTSGISPAPKFLQPDHGSVLGTSTSLLTVGSQDLDLQGGNTGSAHQRIPISMQKLEKKVYQTSEDVTLAVINPDNEVFTTSVQDSSGKPVNVPITERNNGTATTVDLAPSIDIKPGLYKVMVTDQENNTTEQDFAWGVLALNTDKSLYHPNETADMAFAVLNDKGDMVCDADVTLQITNQSLGINDMLSTQNTKDNRITVNKQCQQHGFSLQPDYEAHYKFGGAGVYHLQLTATTKNGTHTISDSIQVNDQILFDVQRVSATRIYPPNTYPMIFNITANRDFNGTVTETVPDSFTITPATQSANVSSYNNTQTLYLNSTDPTAQLQQTLLATGQTQLVMPFQGNFPITQGFGIASTDPTLQAFYSHFGLSGHDGIDFGVPVGTSLYAVDDGTILWAGPGDYGITIIIQHTWGKSYYGHLSNTSVTVGEHVTKGQQIGYSGNTGDGTGPHLHFGMKPNTPDTHNGYYGKIDPMPFLPYGHQAQSISMHQPAQSLVSMAHDTTVLGASDSATPSPTQTEGSGPSATPTPTAGLEPTATPTPQSGSQQATGSAMTISITPTPTVSAKSPQTAPSAPSLVTTNTQFTVLDKEIKINEAIANNALTQKVKIITWKVNLKKGEKTSLGYSYQTPKVSPQFYLLGPAKFYEDGSNKVVFEESRQWQIAADDVGVEWFQDTSGPKWNGYSWPYRKKLTIDHTKVFAASSRPSVTFMESGTDATHGTQFYSSRSFGSFASDCTVANTGSCSLKLDGTGGNAAAAIPDGGISSTAGRVTVYVNFGTFQNTGTLHFLTWQNGGTFDGVAVQLTSADKLQCNDGIHTGSTVLSASTWYRISFGYTITGSPTATATYKIYLNGNQEIDCGGETLVASAGSPNVLTLGSDISGQVVHFDDIYADTGTGNSDPGDIHVINKRPFSNGVRNQFTSAGAGSGYGSGNAPFVNEVPLSTASNVASPNALNKRETYTLESASAGVNISSDFVVADGSWVYAKASGACTAGDEAHIVNNGIDTKITLTTTDAMYTNYNTSTIYPSSNNGVGITSCYVGSTTQTVTLEEAGMLVAYTTTNTAATSLSNFPVLVSLSGDNDIKNAQASCNDVVFTDSTGRNKLNHQLDDAASDCSSGKLNAWVKVSSLSTSTDTIIYLYFGNPSAADQEAATSAWDSNYKAVWHFKDGTTLSAADTLGTNNGTITNATATSGQIDGGASFNGTTAFINFGQNASIDPGGTNTWTVELWFKRSAADTSDHSLVDKGTTGTSGYQVDMYEPPCPTGTEATFKADKKGAGATDICMGVPPADTNWHSLAMVYGASVNGSTTNVLYIDGQPSGPSDYNNNTANVKTSSTANLTMGADGGGINDFFGGSIDETRLSSNARDAGWIYTEYNNENSPSTFATLGTLETKIFAPTLDKLMRHGEWFDSTGTLQPFSF